LGFGSTKSAVVYSAFFPARPDSNAIQSAPRPFNPHFLPFNVKYLTFPYFRAMLRLVVTAMRTPRPLHFSRRPISSRILPPLSPLDATLARMPISVDFKGFTGNVSSLDATLTKNGGRGHTALPNRLNVFCPITYPLSRIGQTTTPSLVYTISVLFSPLWVRGIAHSSRVGGPK
jgi:hypothetical protein